MFGWFKRKKKQEERSHDAILRKAVADKIHSVAISNSNRMVVVEDHSSDMFTSPLYSYLPGNIWHHQYGIENSPNPASAAGAFVASDPATSSYSDPSPAQPPSTDYSPSSVDTSSSVSVESGGTFDGGGYGGGS